MSTTLTNTTIKTAVAGDTLWDKKIQGLHLRIGKNGGSYFLYYRTRTGLQRRPKIGSHPEIALDKARTLAREIKDIVAVGRDPMMEWGSDKGAPVVKDLAETYMERHGSLKKSGHDDALVIRADILPKLKNVRVKDATHDQIDRFHKSMAHKPYQANRILSLLSKMFNLAEKWGYRPLNTNPCRHVVRFSEEKRKRYMNREEAARIAEALEYFTPVCPRSVIFIYMLILTGARKSEIANARWEWIVENRLELPDSKTGARTIHLPQQVMSLLNRIPKNPTKNGTILGIKNPRSTWTMVCERAGVEGLRLHDLRHSFASVALSAGLTLSQIGELLGHKSVQTTHRYAHLLTGAGQAGAATTADALTNMLNGTTTQSSSSHD